TKTSGGELTLILITSVPEAFDAAVVTAVTSATRKPKLICIMRGMKSYPMPKSACQCVSVKATDVLPMALWLRDSEPDPGITMEAILLNDDPTLSLPFDWPKRP